MPMENCLNMGVRLMSVCKKDSLFIRTQPKKKRLLGKRKEVVFLFQKVYNLKKEKKCNMGV